MSSCEKCWSDARAMQMDYHDLVKERNAAKTECTMEQQAGLDARECPWCGRMTLHQHTGEPMCGCSRSPREVMTSHSGEVAK